MSYLYSHHSPMVSTGQSYVLSVQSPQSYGLYRSVLCPICTVTTVLWSLPVSLMSYLYSSHSPMVSTGQSYVLSVQSPQSYGLYRSVLCPICTVVTVLWSLPVSLMSYLYSHHSPMVSTGQSYVLSVQSPQSYGLYRSVLCPICTVTTVLWSLPVSLMSYLYSSHSPMVSTGQSYVLSVQSPQSYGLYRSVLCPICTVTTVLWSLPVSLMSYLYSHHSPMVSTGQSYVLSVQSPQSYGLYRSVLCPICTVTTVLWSLPVSLMSYLYSHHSPMVSTGQSYVLSVQ